MRTQPAILPKIREIVLMGGAYGAGNFTPSAEFNIFADPEAAAWCSLRRSISDDGPRSYQPDRLHPGRDCSDGKGWRPCGELFSDIMNFTLKTQFENYGWLAAPVHDATCIGYLINPDGIKTQEMYVEVDVNSGPLLWAYRLRRVGRSWQARQYQSRHHY